MAEEETEGPDLLASPEDVAEILGRDLTPEEETRVVPILLKASELFRREAGRRFTGGFAENVFRAVGGVVKLIEQPVESVLSVKDHSTGDPIQVSSRFRNELRLASCLNTFVRVTYTWDPEVPDLVRTTIADVARQVLGLDPKAVAGMSQFGKTVGPYNRQETYASWAQGGQTRLSPDDIALARSYRQKAHGPIVQVAT